MLKKILNLRKDELVRGSLILFIAINLFNFMNYLFHFFMARMLGPADYGVLAVLMSILYIISVPSESIQTIVSRYTSKYLAEKKLGKIKSLLSRTLKKSVKFAFFIFLIYIPVAFFLSNFLKIDFLLILLTGTIVFGFFMMPINRGILQGKKKFKELGLNMITESGTKLIIAIFLVYIGLGVYGAISGNLMGVFLAFVFAFIFMKDVVKSKKVEIETKGIYAYGMPVFIVIISIMVMLSMDIILAKRFFSPEIAGQYAVASMLGKMIFFGTAGISKAMFPFATEKFENGDKSHGVFYKSLLIIFAFILIALVFFGLIPKFIVGILFGSQYLAISNIVIYTGLAFGFLSITNLILIYSLRAHKIRFSYLLFIFILLEIILLSLFNSSLKSFSIALVTANFIMMLGSLLFLKWKDINNS